MNRTSPSLAQRARKTVSFTRRTHWRNSARTSATRTSCAQHKCRPQGGGQSTTALVDDLVTIEVQAGQRRICLVKIARTCHEAAWSTHLTDVDNHVSATTLDAKLTELLHFMPCSAGRELCGQRKKNVQKLSSCVTSWHKCSYCVIHWPVESFHHLNTSPKTSGTCFAASRRDTEHFQPSLMSCSFIAQYGLRQHNTVHTEQPRRPTFDRGGWLLRFGEWCSFAPGRSTSTLVKKRH